MKILQLSLKKQWFDLTKSGIKTEDYRDITPYWIKRLINYKDIPHWGIEDLVREFEYHGNELHFLEQYGKKFTSNIMTLGYPRSTDSGRILKFEHKGIEIRTGNHEWGAEPDKNYFVIKHGIKKLI